MNVRFYVVFSWSTNFGLGFFLRFEIHLMCSHNVNFIHKIKNSFKSIWLLRFYGFPFSFHFFGFYQTTRSINSVQYFSIKKLLRISAKVLRLMFGWIPVSQNSPDSQCDWVFFSLTLLKLYWHLDMSVFIIKLPVSSEFFFFFEHIYKYISLAFQLYVVVEFYYPT